MKRTLAQSGYTIVEVMIVLAVSGGMLVAAMTMISGQQRRTEFTTGVRDIENSLQDVFNDVESGYFPNNGTDTCTVNGARIPTVNPSGADSAQGTNGNCITLGKALQFYQTDSAPGRFRVLNIVGARQVSNEVSVTSLSQANPRVYQEFGLEEATLRNGLNFKEVRVFKNTATVEANQTTLAVVSNLGIGGSKENGAKDDTATESDGGARIANVRLNSRPLGPLSDLQSAISNVYFSTSGITDAAGGAVVCLTDSGRPAAIAIGLRLNSAGALVSSGQRLSTDAYFDGDAVKFGCTA